MRGRAPSADQAYKSCLAFVQAMIGRKVCTPTGAPAALEITIPYDWERGLDAGGFRDSELKGLTAGTAGSPQRLT